MAARLGLALLAALFLVCGTARAEQFQRLHVRSFTLSSDAARPQLEAPFHVTLRIHVSENVTHLDNVFLPTFFGAEELGDEQQITHGAGGTTYRETLTLVAHERGMLTVSPAYLDAIDARDGKAKRFISNSLQIPVGGGPVSAVWRILRTALAVAIDLVLVAAALFVLGAIFYRRRKRVEAAPPPVRPEPPPPHPPKPAPQPKSAVADALQQLRNRRDRAAVLQLRAALWHLAGAGAGETLGDVLRRPAACDEHVRRLLMLVERAAFIDQDRLAGAVDDVLSEQAWTFA